MCPLMRIANVKKEFCVKKKAELQNNSLFIQKINLHKHLFSIDGTINQL